MGRRVAADRSDDPTALAAMARLSTSADERERYYAAAFDANPFSLPLIRDYQKYLSVGAGSSAGTAPAGGPVPTSGSQVRTGLQQMQRGELIAARLNDAVAQGCDLATASTEPGTASQRHYERMGFEVVYTKVTLAA